MQKILQLTAHFSPNVGGVETHLDDLVRGLIERKHQVFVLTYLPLTAKADAKIWESSKNLRILRIPWMTGLFYKLVKNPILEFLYLSPGLFIVTPFVLLFSRPDVIHTHGLIAGAVGVLWGKLFGIKTITTTHSLYHFPSNGLYKTFAKWIFGTSSRVLTLSRQSKGEIEKLGIESEKITVFTYWVDLNKFKTIDGAKKKLGWDKKFVIFFVGRLVEEKGILVLLDSVKSWNKQIYLVIAGTGPLEAFVKDEAKKSKNLGYVGKIDNDKLPLYYSASDLVIVPSIHDEGFGRVILESLACGTPVIAANRGAIPEAMDKSVGSLIEINPQNIADEVNRLHGNAKILTSLSKGATEYARKKYSANNINIFLKTYEKILFHD